MDTFVLSNVSSEGQLGDAFEREKSFMYGHVQQQIKELKPGGGL